MEQPGLNEGVNEVKASITFKVNSVRYLGIATINAKVYVCILVTPLS